MKSSLIFFAHPLALAITLMVSGIGAIHAQVTPGPAGSIVGQPPGQAGSIIGQPPAPGQSGTGSMQSNYPGTGSTAGRDVVRDKLDRANREAADIDRDGRISPEEASRLPGGSLPPPTPPGGTPLPR
ncbi:hypothetical protein [Nitrosovibrio tenuis]|uniref:EF hand n=1 Tax=Nitrosovibrio tenuis TaxID=1233 RepID=A0A1H7K824_9PROT|nr:hypothetical protein [Nitrosovibrio tenuis]SEK82065.1 hypothetical protein SAMN05216387_103114 [Nitrosovibrio tenuis]